MVPLVTVSAAPMVGLTSVPNSSDGLALGILIAWFVAAFLAIFRSEAAPLPIAKVRLLCALLMTLPDSTRAPSLVFTLSLHDALPISLALTLPAPISLALVLSTIFEVSVITALPPSS